MISSDILLRRAYKIMKAVFRQSHLRLHFLANGLLLAIIKKKPCGDGFPISWLMANVGDAQMRKVLPPKNFN